MHIATGTSTRLKEFARQPTTLAMLVVLPPIVIEMYGVALESFPNLPTLGTDPATAGRISGTLFAVAFLAGLIGLFQVISAREGDERLRLCGASRSTLLATRLLTLVVVSGVGTLVSFLMLATRVDVAAPTLALGVLFGAGLLYGLLGVVVGTILPRDLEGSLVLVFVADIDNALSSGLFDVGAAAKLSLLYHPHELLVAAVLHGNLASEHVLPAGGILLGLLALAFGAYTVAAESEGVVG